MKLLFAAAAMVAATNSQACDRVAEIAHVRVKSGPVMVAVYADEASFRKQPAASFKLPADKDMLAVPLCGFTSAELALIAYQDIDANGKLDTNAFGMPSEPWGSSGPGNPMGPPSWRSSKIGLGDTNVRVVLSR